MLRIDGYWCSLYSAAACAEIVGGAEALSVWPYGAPQSI